MQEETPKNPIITPNDPERWPLMEMSSQSCNIPIEPADEQAIVEMDTLLDIMNDDAAGLAAVQIGVPRRIFLLRNGKGNTNNVYINPTIVSRSRKTKRAPEACLSLPGMMAEFPRPKAIKLQYFDLQGEIHEETFNGFWARAVCHEIDHLNGVLITQHLEQELTKKSQRTKFGMKITPHRINVIAQRRAKNKNARRARRKGK